MAGLQGIVVHAVYGSGVNIGTGSGDNHFLGAGVDVRHGLVAAGENTGTLINHIHLQIAPGQLGRVALGGNQNFVTVDNHLVAIDGNFTGEAAVY